MKLKNHYLKLYKDNYNIYNLIKKIDCNYRLYFDEKNKCFVIVENITNEICLKTKNVNPSIIKKLQTTRVENSKKIFSQIDEFNENLTQSIMAQSKQKTVDSAIELTKLSKRLNKISESEIKKITEGAYA